ncbi:MAG TPA: hypothetical protein VMD25_14050 [Acidobacteriaceae bacterium]|nr:hypothetical protein [Acidobacteriaceae bacterium]
MSLILMVAAVVHLPLLIAELPLKSYDTNFHIFFASHYVHHWFNPWNTKWFAGFSQTTYPPLAQQWVAILSWIFGLNLAYMAVQFAAVLLLAWGMYRFASIWVSPRAASFAALASVVLASESFLIYNAGQLATTAAAPLYLLALPYLYEWLRFGGGRNFIKALVLFTAAGAAHHATLIFGSMFFALPVLALALMDRDREESSAGGVWARAIGMTIAVGIAVGLVLLPFWIGLYHYPVTQTPIPHPSRASYILSPAYGINYFIVPYGALILLLPFIIIRGAVVPRLRPLMLGFWVCFLVGLGGTTPVGYWLLRRAFEVLTFERFSYWATLLALPIAGLIISDLVVRFRRRAAIPIAILAALSCAVAAAWTTYHPTDEADFSVDHVAEWLNRDGHYDYRYLTLGFGNQLSRLAIETVAGSVDGESNSSRMLPELTKYGGAQLTMAKGFGKGGLESLRAMLRDADRYGLKWVIVRDPYYDPLLHFAGWRQVDELDYGSITIWAKDGVPPATPVNQSQIPPHWQGVLWGTLPIGSSILAILLAFVPDDRRQRMREGKEEEDDAVTPISQENIAPGRMVS